MTAEEGVTQPIGALAGEMGRPVELNGKACCRAVEVGEVGTDGELSAKETPLELPTPKQVPETPLGRGGVIAMVAGQEHTPMESSFHAS